MRISFGEEMVYRLVLPQFANCAMLYFVLLIAVTGMFGDDPTVNQAALDLSVNEFPTLGNRSSQPQPNPIPAAARNYGKLSLLYVVLNVVL